MRVLCINTFLQPRLSHRIKAILYCLVFIVSLARREKCFIAAKGAIKHTVKMVPAIRPQADYQSEESCFLSDGGPSWNCCLMLQKVVKLGRRSQAQ